MRYNLYCSPKPYGTSVPPFSSTKGCLPSNSSVIKLLYIQQFDNSPLGNLLTTILPNEKSLAYQAPPWWFFSFLGPLSIVSLFLRVWPQVFPLTLLVLEIDARAKLAIQMMYIKVMRVYLKAAAA